MNPSPLFQLESAGYAPTGTEILVDINWQIRAGEHWAILGPNGSGKTTLLKVATGYLWPTSGRVLRRGRELIDLYELRRSMGWLSSDMISQIPRDETALETVVSGKFGQFGLKWLESVMPSREDFAQAAIQLERVDCQSLAEKPFGLLSQGERQQVLIARTGMAGPTMLILDEPCAGMDPGVRERFLSWLADRLQDATFPTVLFSTHHLEEIVPGIDWAFCLRSGREVATGKVAEVLGAESIAALYDTPVARVINRGGRYWPVWGSEE